MGSAPREEGGGGLLPADVPLASGARFRADDVYTCTGIGGVPAGQVVGGSVRPAAAMRLLRVAAGTRVEIPVRSS